MNKIVIGKNNEKYIISDESPNVGDWCYIKDEAYIFGYDLASAYSQEEIRNSKKIIACELTSFINKFGVILPDIEDYIPITTTLFDENLANKITEEGKVCLDKVLHNILEQRHYRELTFDEEETIKSIIHNSEPLPLDIQEFVNKEFWNLI